MSTGGWTGEAEVSRVAAALSIVLKMLVRDVGRLPADHVVRWVGVLSESGYFAFLDNRRHALDCLRALTGTDLPGYDRLVHRLESMGGGVESGLGQPGGEEAG